MITTILFDLDGTLLDMDQDLFTKTYLNLLSKTVAKYGYEPNKLVDAIWQGTAKMIKNDGKITNFDAFWGVFSSIFGKKVFLDMSHFDDFYTHEFNDVSSTCKKIEGVDAAIKKLKEKGFRLILASNPIFPLSAQQSRIKWAGLNPSDFDYITSYENSHYSKPNPKYFEEILSSLSLTPDECVMVGNDAVEDLAATKVGIKTFLSSKDLINKTNVDLSTTPPRPILDILSALITINEKIS